MEIASEPRSMRSRSRAGNCNKTMREQMAEREFVFS